MSSRPAISTDNLLDELQNTLAQGTVAKRVEALRKVTDLFVNGAPTSAQSGETFDVINPATNEKLTTVAKAGRADVDAAVHAARTAFEGGKWIRMGAGRRASILLKAAAIMRDRF